MFITFVFNMHLFLHVNERAPTPLLRKDIGAFSVLTATTDQLDYVKF